MTGSCLFYPFLVKYPYLYIFGQKVGLLQNISVEDQDFVGTWFPGSPSLSHPDPNYGEGDVCSLKDCDLVLDGV